MKKAMVILCAVLFFCMATSDRVDAVPYYNEAEFVNLTGLNIVEDFESYQVGGYPPYSLRLYHPETFANGSVSIESVYGYEVHIVFPGHPVTPPLHSKALAISGEDDYRLIFSTPQQAVGFTYLANYTGVETVRLYGDEASTQLIATVNLETISTNGDYNFFGFIVPNGGALIKVMDFYTTDGDSINEALDDLRFNVNSAPVPEPATMLLLASGLVGLAGYRKLKNR